METPSKKDYIRGLIIYRYIGQTMEFLLLKKTRENDWSPPKGKRESSAESEIETARRETEEETSLIEADYQLLNSTIYFQYRNSSNVLKKVTLWPAKLRSCNKVIQLSVEHEKYRWLPIDEATNIIKPEYRWALIQANTVLRNQME